MVNRDAKQSADLLVRSSIRRRWCSEQPKPAIVGGMPRISMSRFGSAVAMKQEHMIS